jgi:hypothetical protein
MADIEEEENQELQLDQEQEAIAINRHNKRMPGEVMEMDDSHDDIHFFAWLADRLQQETLSDSESSEFDEDDDTTSTDDEDATDTTTTTTTTTTPAKKVEDMCEALRLTISAEAAELIDICTRLAEGDTQNQKNQGYSLVAFMAEKGYINDLTSPSVIRFLCECTESLITSLSKGNTKVFMDFAGVRALCATHGYDDLYYSFAVDYSYLGLFPSGTQIRRKFDRWTVLIACVLLSKMVTRGGGFEVKTLLSQADFLEAYPEFKEKVSDERLQSMQLFHEDMVLAYKLFVKDEKSRVKSLLLDALRWMVYQDYRLAYNGNISAGDFKKDVMGRESKTGDEQCHSTIFHKVTGVLIRAHLKPKKRKAAGTKEPAAKKQKPAAPKKQKAVVPKKPAAPKKDMAAKKKAPLGNHVLNVQTPAQVSGVGGSTKKSAAPKKAVVAKKPAAPKKQTKILDSSAMKKKPLENHGLNMQTPAQVSGVGGSTISPAERFDLAAFSFFRGVDADKENQKDPSSDTIFSGRLVTGLRPSDSSCSV